MNRWLNKVAVVTGASSGIGEAITEDLVRSGVTVVGLARRVERLEKLSTSLKESGGKFYARPCDLRKEDEILRTFEWINEELGGVDILVNNAGLMKNRKIISDDVESFRNILEVNLLATTICIRESVASMKSRGVNGHVINLNSVFGHYAPGVGMDCSLYAASKTAVTALTETVRRELVHEGNNKIKITSISPGLVKTELFRVSGHPEVIYDSSPHLEPRDISEAVIHVLGTRDKVHITEMTIRPLGEIF